jgi:hypothetical protein
MESFYKDTTLQALGLVVQLRHDKGDCPSPSPIQLDFVVVDLSGIHLVNVRYCECHHLAGGSRSHIQLLRFQWFPCTVKRPQSAFTFDTLDTFHLITLQGKLSAYDFYQSLARKTDNTGLIKVKVSAVMQDRIFVAQCPSSEPLSAIFDCHPYLASPQSSQAGWPWTRPCRCRCNKARAMRN